MRDIYSKRGFGLQEDDERMAEAALQAGPSTTVAQATSPAKLTREQKGKGPAQGSKPRQLTARQKNRRPSQAEVSEEETTGPANRPMAPLETGLPTYDTTSARKASLRARDPQGKVGGRGTSRRR